MNVLTELKRHYDYALDLTDKRSRTWPMMSTPMIPLGTMAVYLVVVKYGPVFMKDRPAFNLRWVLFFYNFGLVILSAYMVHEFLMTAVEAGYSLQCEVLDFSYNPSALRILNVTWVYYVSKYIEVADTVSATEWCLHMSRYYRCQSDVADINTADCLEFVAIDV